VDGRSSESRWDELLAQGDRAGAATEVLRGVGPQVLRFLRSLLRDECDAAEAFSMFAEALWRGLPGFRGEASLRTWALRLARNAALDLRKEAWRRHVRRLDTSEVSALAEEMRTSSGRIAAERRDHLVELRAALSEADRTLLILRVDHALSWPDVAQVLAREGSRVQPVTLMKRFERLKARLERLARERGLLD